MTPSEAYDSVAVYVKTERFSPCLGLGKLVVSAWIFRDFVHSFYYFKTLLISLAASLTPPAFFQVTKTKGPRII